MTCVDPSLADFQMPAGEGSRLSGTGDSGHDEDPIWEALGAPADGLQDLLGSENASLKLSTLRYDNESQPFGNLPDLAGLADLAALSASKDPDRAHDVLDLKGRLSRLSALSNDKETNLLDSFSGRISASGNTEQNTALSTTSSAGPSLVRAKSEKPGSVSPLITALMPMALSVRSSRPEVPPGKHKTLSRLQARSRIVQAPGCRAFRQAQVFQSRRAAAPPRRRRAAPSPTPTTAPVFQLLPATGVRGRPPPAAPTEEIGELQLFLNDLHALGNVVAFALLSCSCSMPRLCSESLRGLSLRSVISHLRFLTESLACLLR